MEQSDPNIGLKGKAPGDHSTGALLRLSMRRDQLVWMLGCCNPHIVGAP